MTDRIDLEEYNSGLNIRDAIAFNPDILGPFKIEKTTEMIEWVSLTESEPNLDELHFLSDGISIYIRGGKEYRFFIQISGPQKSIGEIDFSHWMPLPSSPK